MELFEINLISIFDIKNLETTMAINVHCNIILFSNLKETQYRVKKIHNGLNLIHAKLCYFIIYRYVVKENNSRILEVHSDSYIVFLT